MLLFLDLAFPNGEMETFCLGEYDLFDLFNIDCKV